MGRKIGKRIMAEPGLPAVMQDATRLLQAESGPGSSALAACTSRRDSWLEARWEDLVVRQEDVFPVQSQDSGQRADNLRVRMLTLVQHIKSLIKKLPGIRDLVAHRDHLHAQLDQLISQHEQLGETYRQCRQELEDVATRQEFVPPGHFYSPVPSFEEIYSDAARIFGERPARIPGVGLNASAQLELLHSFIPYYREMEFSAEKRDGLRYYFDNPAYSYSDAILLHCMIRHLGPARIVEVGSGFSSCMMLDTNELHFNGAIRATFIEPYPELLFSLLKDSDEKDISVIAGRLQDVDLEVFKSLRRNDILFIDSTHVSKIDSDVNRILFEILPALAPGVYIHFHDIFYPFEYPEQWLRERRAWNEAYVLRAFLQYNREFSVVLMNTFMQDRHRKFFADSMPLCLENTGGSIWLRKENPAG